jgi:hypothetical protein
MVASSAKRRPGQDLKTLALAEAILGERRSEEHETGSAVGQ